MVDLADYEGMQARTKRDLAQLLQDRKDIDRAISLQKKLVAHYAAWIRRRKAAPSPNLHEEEGESKAAISLTQAVRGIVYTEVGAVLPTEVRDRLVKSGVRKHSANLLSEVHAALRRLWKRGEIEKTRRRHRKAYRRSRETRSS